MCGCFSGLAWSVRRLASLASLALAGLPSLDVEEIGAIHQCSSGLGPTRLFLEFLGLGEDPGPLALADGGSGGL